MWGGTAQQWRHLPAHVRGRVQCVRAVELSPGSAQCGHVSARPMHNQCRAPARCIGHVHWEPGEWDDMPANVRLRLHTIRAVEL